MREDKKTEIIKVAFKCDQLISEFSNLNYQNLAEAMLIALFSRLYTDNTNILENQLYDDLFFQFTFDKFIEFSRKIHFETILEIKRRNLKND